MRRKDTPKVKLTARERQRKNRRLQRRLLRGLFFLVLAAAAYGILQLALFLYVRNYEGPVILDQVYVGTVDVGGMTREEAKEALEEHLAEVTPATMELRGDGRTSERVTYGELGVTADVQTLTQKALQYGKTGSLFSRFRQIRRAQRETVTIPMDYTVGEEAVTDILQNRCGDFYGGPVNATMERKNGETVVTDGRAGNVMDIPGTLQKLEAYLNTDWDGGDGVLRTAYTVEEPRIQGDALRLVQDTLGSFQTSYATTGAASVTNIEAGARHIHGSIVLPGEEFSANAAMEPYTVEEGYTASASYENGLVVESMGGGICQVSTTLYNALLMAEMEVTERYPHSMQINYVEPSRDAAIAGDVKDLKFVNNTEAPIYIEAILANNTLTFNIYGQETRPKGRTVEYVSETLGTQEPEGIRFVATEDAVGYYQVISGPRTGLSAQLWKVVLEDGQEVSREVINTSYYMSSQQTIGVGTATEDEELRDRIVSAIDSQDEAAIRAAIGI